MTEANKEEVKSTRFRWFATAVILLMIVLMVYSGNTMSRQSQMAHGILLGRSNSGDVMSTDSRSASNLIEQLMRVNVLVPPLAQGDHQQVVPLLAGAWGEAVVRDLKAHPEALFLAIREARRVSPGVNPYTLGSFEAEQQQPDSAGIFNSGQINLSDLRPLPTSPLGRALAQAGRSFPVFITVPERNGDIRTSQVSLNTLPPLEQQSLYASLYDFLTVQSAASLPLNAIKPTSPMVNQMIAQRLQVFSLQLAALDVRPFVVAVPEPTEEQLKTQLSTYAAFYAGQASADNPFGFGYRVPDRVKLQTISFKRADVRQVVEAEKTPYEWDVAARIAYAKDASLAGPTSQPTTAPVAPPAYETVKDRVIAATIDGITDARSAEIEKAIRAPMMLDYQQWFNATTTRPGSSAAPTGTPPKTSFGETYDSLAYLQKLAQQVATKFKVQPIVADYTDAYRDAIGLQLLPGFNDAKRALPIDLARRLGRQTEIITGPEYATMLAKDLLDAPAVESLGALVLERNRPSEKLELDRAGLDRETFYFRVTDAERTHPATAVEPIREKLKTDWRLAQAQKMCVAEAQRAVTAIKGGTDFAAAVNTVAPGTAVINADLGPFYYAPPDPIPLGLSRSGYDQLGTRVTDELLGDKSDVAVLDVPQAGKAYIARRLGMRGVWTNADDLHALQQEMRARFAVLMNFPKSNGNYAGLTDEDVAGTWLDSKSIIERFAYKPTTDSKEQ